MSGLSDYNYNKTVWGQWPAGALAVRAQSLFLFYMVEEHAVDKHILPWITVTGLGQFRIVDLSN